MVTATKVNAERVYYNFQGKLPPAPIEEEPARPPAVDDLAKLITDTTLRDGAQDSRIALFPHDARVLYFDLLHLLDNATGTIYSTTAPSPSPPPTRPPPPPTSSTSPPTAPAPSLPSRRSSTRSATPGRSTSA